VLDDAQDVAPDASDDEAEALGTVISLPLFKPRDQLISEWRAIGDPPTCDRGWGAIPSPPGEAMIEPRFVTAALDTMLGLDDVREMAQRDRWPTYCGVDLAGSTNLSADFFALLVIGVEPDSQRRYVLDLKHERGATITRQVSLVREADDVFDPFFRIEGNGPGFANARHLVNQVGRGESFVTTRSSKWSQDSGIPALVGAFASGLIVIPWNGKARRIFDPLVRELRTFPRGRHDDAFDALTFANAAAVKDSTRPRKRPVRIEWLNIPG
jgi:predicted phage terminase large subunit-like protein